MKTKFHKYRLLLYMSGVVVLTSGSCEGFHFELASQNPVLAMNPAGYWPADQGDGEVLQDLSATGNHGVIHHVPWDQQRQLLNFTGAYQWLEIPKHPAYQTPAFSMGGWVFFRSEVIGAQSWMHGGAGLNLIGNKRKPTWNWFPVSTVGAQLYIRNQQVIDVASDSKGDAFETPSWVLWEQGTEDVLGTALLVGSDYNGGVVVQRGGRYSFAGKPNLAIGQWHHLLYCFEPDVSLSQGDMLGERPQDGVYVGTGRLYLNGALIASEDDIGYKPPDTDLQIGIDAGMWFQVDSKSGSLDGSVRDLVWFDRALSGEEPVRLYAATKPTAAPDVYTDSVVVLDGRAIAAHELGSLPPATRQTALLLFNRKDQATLQPLADTLLPALTAALAEPNCQLQAVNLLQKLDNDAANAVLQQAAPKILDVVQDQAKPHAVRAVAALALAAMGAAAAEAVPTLADTLDKLVPDADIQPPHVEELLRNALTRALLDIAPEHKLARQTLERTYAAPMLAKIDLDNPQLANDARYGELRSMIDGGQYLEAMRLYGQLTDSVREYFFTCKAPQDRDYTSTAYFNGCTYKVGEGIAWKGVEKVPQDEYEAIVAELAQQYPAAETWRKSDYEHLYRVPITKTTADGQEQKIYLEGENFILDGADEKLRGWSIFIDELGYIHLMGGQHNTPDPKLYIPGSWEQMGISRDKQSDEYPLQMYWVSTEPECIESLQFAGRRSDPRAIPASYLNYMVLVQSPGNETYLYGRTDAFGFQSWGMYRYDATAKRWTVIGGDPYEVIESARRHDPTWLDLLHGNCSTGGEPNKPSDDRALVWAWQPMWYNFCRDAWGVRFDKTGRMHVRMQITGLDGAGYVRPTSVYAWSDDGGGSFHRPDGSAVKLPLTVNPAPEHNAEIAVDNTLHHYNGDQYDTRQWWALWVGLISESGYRI
jgi:hypothetical protein